MKILMIEPVGYSGICIYTAQLCESLYRQRTEVVLVTSRLYESSAYKAEFPVYQFLGGCDRGKPRLYRALDYLLSWGKLRAVLRRENPDLVHFQNFFVPPVDILVIFLIRIFVAPVVYTVHDLNRSALMTRQKWRSRVNRWIDGFGYHLVNRLIVHTIEDENALRNQFSISQNKICRIRLGNQLYHSEGVFIPDKLTARARLKIPGDVFVILFFGDRRPSKGLDLLIRAFREACRSEDSMQLVVAGEQRILDTMNYREMAEKLGISSRVHFHDGFVPKEMVACFFMACDIVALPYRKVSQSAVVHLAFTFGRPVIASRAGGLPEVVEENKTGFFVDDPERIGELAEALVGAKRQRARLEAMGLEAKRVETEKFGWEPIGAETLNLYGQVLEPK